MANFSRPRLLVAQLPGRRIGAMWLLAVRFSFRVHNKQKGGRCRLVAAKFGRPLLALAQLAYGRYLRRSLSQFRHCLRVLHLARAILQVLLSTLLCFQRLGFV